MEMPRAKKATKHVLFWIKSSRGTNSKIVFEVPRDLSKAEIESALEKWCSRHGARDRSENVVNFGWKEVRILDKKRLERKYALACIRKDKAMEDWRVAAAMFSVRKLQDFAL